MFIRADVLNSAHFDSIAACEQFEINFWSVSSGPAVLINFLAKMASEAQKPLAEMEFFFCG